MDLIPGKRAEHVCKVVMIGDSGVGKTCVIRRFIDNEFSYNFVATIGIDFKIRMMNVNGKYVKVQIWDTAGQERFRSITTAYYRGAKGVIIMYDITNQKSFENVTKWIVNFSRWAEDDVERLLIGNKCDKEDMRLVERIEGEQLAKQSEMMFSETSAKDDVNVDHAFMQLLTKIIDKETKANKIKNEGINKTKTEDKAIVLDRKTSNGEAEKRKCC
ncbi:unnamed protein product [Clavelina lepadiformis]|uniref:Uncharacterized protein n=1 Tax=Clavelina lepadiformis TaxID=159417 RepID=A0ABP0GV10_CLALP